MAIKRYILTCAQSNTEVHAPTWASIVTLAKHYKADILVSRFVYEKSHHSQYEKPTAKTKKSDDRWWDPVTEPYFCDKRVKLAKGLEFCGELQILPTAKRPISGLESYTGRASCIIPHVKIAMESIASGKNEGAKLIYTTGTVTKRNYIQRKAGQVAQFHHSFGGLLVEVDSSGRWFCRQLNCSENGTLHDLDVRVKDGKVTTGNRAEAIMWGDAHVRQADPEVTKIAWGKGGMLDQLRPRYQFFHDILDFKSRNHHEIGIGRARFERYCGEPEDDDVGLEIREAAKALTDRSRDWCKSIVVSSNHHNALLRWLDYADYRADPRNALTFLELQSSVYRAIKMGVKIDIFESAMRLAGVPKVAKFLQEDESFIICHDANGGIEMGMHGHLGLNGGPGSVLGFARMGRKSITGHGHSAAITDGAWRGGTSSKMNMGYNRGPSSWSHSHVLTHVTGKRQMITMWGGQYRAVA